MTAISSAQLKAIHTARRANGIDEATYRAQLADLGVVSSKDLSRDQANDFLDRLNGGGAGVQAASSRPDGALRLEGPYVPVCRALWLTAWNLGLLTDRTDRGLVAFVKRQTGIAHLNWVRDPADSRKVIEALKAWISRETHVSWPTEKDAKTARKSIGRMRKTEVIFRQRQILGEPQQATAALDEPQLNAVMQQLGRRIRARKSTRSLGAEA